MRSPRLRLKTCRIGRTGRLVSADKTGAVCRPANIFYAVAAIFMARMTLTRIATMWAEFGWTRSKRSTTTRRPSRFNNFATWPTKKKKALRSGGIEPPPSAWEAPMMPFHHERQSHNADRAPSPRNFMP